MKKISIEETANLYEKVYIKSRRKSRGYRTKEKRRSIPLFNIIMPSLLFLMLQYVEFSYRFFLRLKYGKND